MFNKNGLTLCLLFAAYLFLDTSCKNIDPTPIVIGEFSKVEIKYQVSLQIKNASNVYNHHCGGVLISLRQVLTFDSCVFTPNRSKIMLNRMNSRVVSGISNLSDIGQVSYIYDIRPFDSLTINSKNTNYTLALITLNRKFQYSASLQPLTIHTEEIEEGELCTVSGWRKTPNVNILMSNILLKNTVRIQSNTLCDIFYGVYHVNNIICAGVEKGSFCEIDTGGPLVCNNKLAGIMTLGHGCGVTSKPSMFLKVYSYMNMIQSLIKSRPLLNCQSNTYSNRRVSNMLIFFFLIVLCLKQCM